MQRGCPAIVRLALFGALLLQSGCGGRPELAPVGERIAAFNPIWDRVLEPFLPEVLERRPAAEELPGAGESVTTEALVIRGPGGYRVECLLARPAGSNLPCALISGRPARGNPQTLADALPLLEMGHALLVCEVYEGALPEGMEDWPRGEEELWQRERATRALQGVFLWAGTQEWCDPLRRYFLGMSRGASLVLPAALRERECRLLLQIAPVSWLPPGRLAGSVPEERMQSLRRLVRPLLPVACAKAMRGTDVAVVLGREDPRLRGLAELVQAFGSDCKLIMLEGAGAQFELRWALEQSVLGDWLEARLAEPWKPPARARSVFDDGAAVPSAD